MRDEDVSVWKGEVTATKNVLAIENNDDANLHGGFSSSVSALERAVAELQAQYHDCNQASLVQFKAATGMEFIPSEAFKVSDSIVQSTEVPAASKF